MRILGNIVWFIFVGILSALYWLMAGVLLSITIIGIPFGLQCFKIAGFTLFPFGKEVKSDFSAHPIANVLWLVFFGWEIAVGYLFAGLILCITIIGIPFGKQCFKLMELSFMPFGSKIN